MKSILIAAAILAISAQAAQAEPPAYTAVNPRTGISAACADAIMVGLSCDGNRSSLSSFALRLHEQVREGTYQPPAPARAQESATPTRQEKDETCHQYGQFAAMVAKAAQGRVPIETVMRRVNDILARNRDLPESQASSYRYVVKVAYIRAKEGASPEQIQVMAQLDCRSWDQSAR